MKNQKGFTLIELLIVIAIISILAAVIYVAVDPARRLAEARNAQRWSEVNAILNSVLQYTVDNRGTMPANLTAVDTGTYVLGTGATCSTCTATTTTGASPCVDLTSVLAPNYITSLPVDPSTGAAADSQYYVYRSAAGRITVGACNPEVVAGTTPTVKVSR
ncbi:MAG: type II secretion system protein [Candidatus Buchananbacteria bacterium]|jgi:type IV pilus assembly protein PilA